MSTREFKFNMTLEVELDGNDNIEEQILVDRIIEGLYDGIPSLIFTDEELDINVFTNSIELEQIKG